MISSTNNIDVFYATRFIDMIQNHHNSLIFSFPSLSLYLINLSHYVIIIWLYGFDLILSIYILFFKNSSTTKMKDLFCNTQLYNSMPNNLVYNKYSLTYLYNIMPDNRLTNLCSFLFFSRLGGEEEENIFP